MSTQVTLAQIAPLAPSARSSYREAFGKGQGVLDHFSISANNLRVAHFMAQVLHECGGLTIQFENLNYSAQGLRQNWPKRFKPIGKLDPYAYAHKPEKIANEVYGGRMGNTAPGDGYTYRGRGLLQLTGKDGYGEVTTLLRQSYANAPDFTAAPDAAISAEWCLHAAAAIWHIKGCNALADRDSIRAVTKAINGGTIGLASREEWLRRTKHTWP